jgi:biotin carboxyl carrier protein
MLTASVNNTEPVTVDFTTTGPTLNDAPFPWDMVRLSDRTFHILRGIRSYNAELLELDRATKTVSLMINGHRHTVQLKDRFDQLLERMGMANAANAKVGDLKAPMPGLIVGISVQPGDTVAKGDSLLILEAMKMENNLKASAGGTVKTIRTTKGDRVEKGQVLLEFV